MPVWIKKTMKVVLILLLICFLVIEGLVISCFWKKAPEGLDYIIVLGTQVLESGPNKELKFRLDAAGEYLMKNPDTIAIVSGGQGSDEPVSEAKAMYDYLVEYGIDSDRIRMEDQSVSTVENLQFSHKLMENPDGSVGIVTSNFHVFRGVQLAKSQGYKEVYGLSSPSDWLMLPKNMLREFVVMIKDVLVGNL